MPKRKTANPADEHPLLHPPAAEAAPKAETAPESTLPPEPPTEVEVERDATGAIISQRPAIVPFVAEENKQD